MRPMGKIYDEVITTLLSGFLDGPLDGAHGVLDGGQCRVVSSCRAPADKGG